MMVNVESLGFGLLVGQKQQLELWAQGNCDEHFYIIDQFIDQTINHENNQHINR